MNGLAAVGESSPLRGGLAILCAYELGALVGCPWPTITRLVHNHRSTRATKIMVWAGLGGLAWHLLVEETH